MATEIVFEYENKEYALGYTVDVLKRMEKNGFPLNRLDELPLTGVEDLFYYAFEKNHRATPNSTRSRIYENFCKESDDNNEGLTDALLGMIVECIESMKPKGNISWKVSKG